MSEIMYVGKLVPAWFTAQELRRNYLRGIFKAAM